MSALKSLTFTTLSKIGVDPTFDRHANIIAHLKEQKLLPKDSNYTRTLRIWMKKDGQLTPVDRRQRVLPWWRRMDPMFSLFDQVQDRLSSRRARTQSPFHHRIPFVIDILITAVRNGGLDDLLAQTKKSLMAATARKAARVISPR